MGPRDARSPDLETPPVPPLASLHALHLSSRENVLIRQHQQEIPKIVWGSSKPVLEAEHEAARILRFFHRQVFENCWERVEQFEHGVLKTSPPGLLPLFHEAGNRTFALAELRH